MLLTGLVYGNWLLVCSKRDAADWFGLFKNEMLLVCSK